MMHPFSQTTWRNPTGSAVRLRLMTEPGVFHEPVIEPGKTLALPSHFDNAIQTVRDGVVCGGLAPHLVPEGRERLPLHEAIAKAAKLGDVERRLVTATGMSAGGLSLDAAAQLHAKVADLEAKLSESDAAEDLRARMTQLEQDNRAEIERIRQRERDTATDHAADLERAAKARSVAEAELAKANSRAAELEAELVKARAPAESAAERAPAKGHGAK